jgi:hypothetical protein
MNELGIRKMMALVAVLFFMIPCFSFSQCKTEDFIDRTLVTQGISDGIDHYYQNLIVQDIALSSQLAFEKVSIRFDYRIRYQVDKCKPGKLEIKVFPPILYGSPLFYMGYDISSSIRPEKADIVFNLVRQGGFVTDSLVFINVPVDKQESLYSSLSYAEQDSSVNVSVQFSRAVFYYTMTSYEMFRDHLLQIDRYYAAAVIADSTERWISKGFLSETGTKSELIFRQLELERIINYIDPSGFDLVLDSGATDVTSLKNKFNELARKNNRFKAIIKYNKANPVSNTFQVKQSRFVTRYLDRLDYYYYLAYNGDFHYVNFIEGLSVPAYSNASLVSAYRLLSQEYGIPEPEIHHLQPILVQGLISRGSEFESAGNQLRALSYYRAAGQLSGLLFLEKFNAKAILNEQRMRDSIAFSYLAISRKSAQTGNPALASQYYLKSRALYPGESSSNPAPVWMQEHAAWMYHDFEIQAVKYLELNKFEKSLSYLHEIRLQCIAVPEYPCPEQFNEWMQRARKGTYLELLKKADLLFAKEEFQEAGQQYRNAVALRLGAGYRVDKDVAESVLERKFRQISYDDLLDEAMKFYRNEEYISALYFFNKALFLGKSGVLEPFADLMNYRQTAARQVISQNLSEGRVRAWAHDFAGAGTILHGLENLLAEYQLDRSDSLTLQFLNLKERVLQAECEKVVDEYDVLMGQSFSAENDKDFIVAHSKASEAVELSMDNLKCRIRDEEAWYRKVVLETPAEYQQMEHSLEQMAIGNCDAYLEHYQELRGYYLKNKLMDYGIAFTPLFDRVVIASDSMFLAGIFRHYIQQRNYGHALDMLRRMKETGILSNSLSSEQKMIAGYLARRDVSEASAEKPWVIMDSYTVDGKWFRPFRKAYKREWLKASNWKIADWPLIWKK